MNNNSIPTSFKELNPEEVKKALQGHTDELSSELVKIEALYRQHKYCPNSCGPTMEKCGVHPNFAFGDQNWSIARCILKCHSCGLSLNPFNGMIVETGDPNKAIYGNTPIIKIDD